MSVSIANLTSNYDEDGGSGSTIGSITLTANRLGLLTVVSRTGISANPNIPTITGWTIIDEQLFDSTSSSRRRVSLFRRLDGSDATGTHAIDFGGQNQTDVLWIVDEATGIDTGGVNGASAIVQVAKAVNEGGSSSLTATLAAFGSADNATFGAFGWDGITSVPTVGSGFSLLVNQNDSGTDISSLTEWKSTNDTSVDFSYSPDAALVGGIAIEIKAAVAAGGIRSMRQLVGHGQGTRT